MSILIHRILNSTTIVACCSQGKTLFNHLSYRPLHRTLTPLIRHVFIENGLGKYLLPAALFAGMLCMALVSNPAAAADRGSGLSHRIAILEAREEIRATLHAFVKALNSSLISGETNPLGPVAAALHPKIVLSATPPPTAFDPFPTPVVFTGIDQVVDGYGRVVVFNTKPNIVASDIDVKLLDKSSAEADLRFANSVTFPAGCLLGTPDCAQILLFADVFVSFKRGDQRNWLVTNIDLIHYIATVNVPNVTQ